MLFEPGDLACPGMDERPGVIEIDLWMARLRVDASSMSERCVVCLRY
jgi:hypothetical protein